MMLSTPYFLRRIPFGPAVGQRDHEGLFIRLKVFDNVVPYSTERSFYSVN